MCPMEPGKYRYLSYFLRLWFVRQNGYGIWRASLEDPHDGTRSGFANIEALMNYLYKQTQETGDKKPDSDPAFFFLRPSETSGSKNKVQKWILLTQEKIWDRWRQKLKSLFRCSKFP